MCDRKDPSKMACKGAPTVTIRSPLCDMEQCQACGKVVPWDMVDSSIFGFPACNHARN